LKNNNFLPHTAPDENPEDHQDHQALIPHQTDWLKIGQFIFSSLAALSLLGLSFFIFIVTYLQDSFGPLGFRGNNLSSYLFAAGLGGIGLLLVPSAVYAGRDLFGQRYPVTFQWGKLSWISILAPILILLGYGLQIGPDWIRPLLPILHVLANSVAVFWLLGLVHRKLPGQSTSRLWGSFASGIGLTPLVTFFLEVMILIGIALIWIGLSDMMPGFRQDLLDLAAQIQSQSGDPQDLQQALGVFAARPGVLITLFGYVALIIPVVEELLKPLAVWLLWRQKLEPWEGFVIGATSGAGYALFENLTIGAVAESWTMITLTRLGTAAVHLFTGGVMGWGVASGIKEKKIGRIASAFLGAVGLHGIWNGLNILAAVGSLAPVQQQVGPFLTGMAVYVPVALVILALGSFWGLVRANKHFRRG
jgi:hypothetical protein